MESQKVEKLIDCMNNLKNVNKQTTTKLLLATLPIIFEASGRKKYATKRYWESDFVKTRSNGFYVHSLPALIRNDEMLRSYYRLTPTQFEYLVNLIGPLIERHRTTSSRKPISVGERLIITLGFLASGSSQKSVTLQHQVGKTTVSNIIYETCSALWNKLQPIVLLPPTTPSEWTQIAEEFETKWNFPHCIGAIDGKHIRIQAVANSGSINYNYKGFHSKVLLAVCDAQYRFKLVDIGANGRQSDGGVFSRSSMGQRFQEGTMGVPQECPVTGTDISLPYVLVGDQAFGLSTFMMRPFCQKSGIDLEKRIFNYRLSRARRAIENAFGILAARWRIFLNAINGNEDTIEMIIKAALCLHNFLMQGRESNRNLYCDSSFGDRELRDGRVVSGSWRNEAPNGAQAFVNINEAHQDNTTASAIRIQQKFAEYFENQGAVPWQYTQMFNC